MKKTDIILIAVIAFIGIVAYIILQLTVNNSGMEDGTAIVIFEDKRILEIYLEDGSYKILNTNLGITVDEDNFLYTIPDTNGSNDLVIEYKDFKVRVAEEVSPQNICSEQMWTNSPLKPITCLPNSLVIIIETSKPSNIDDITG
jgi:hypothetical protein